MTERWFDRGEDRSAVLPDDQPEAFVAQGWFAGYALEGPEDCPWRATEEPSQRAFWLTGYFAGSAARDRITWERMRKSIQ
jgi:ribosome modulation factor